MASAAQPRDVRKILELAIDNNFLEARKLMQKVMYDNGLAGLDMIKFFQRELLNLKIPNKSQMELYIACGEAEFRLVEGSDEFVQLEAFLAKASILSGK